MKIMKHLKEDYIQLDKAIYKPYKVCDIPSNFGCIAMFRDEDGIPTKDGISEWFNYKGYTYIFDKMAKS
tara:strand:+ start:501 stop:707 length:207 start_codon:yes stop_codon:yes gene_type:complete